MKRRILSVCTAILLVITMLVPAYAAEISVDEMFTSNVLLANDVIYGEVSSINENILRIYGDNRYETSLLVAECLLSILEAERFDNIVVTSGTNFPDALSGAYLAIQRQAPILLVNKNYVDKVNLYIQYRLNPGGTVYLLGGSSAVPDSVGSGIGGISVKRLGGANRYETNLAILNEAGTANQNILICTGRGFADSLSASAAGVPILLVKDKLTDAQKQILSRNTGTKFIIGGESAVSTGIENELQAYGNVVRIGGANRYETSVLVAERTGFYLDGAMAAYAKNFPDGLCGGPLAYYLGVPMILTATGKESVAVQYANTYGTCYGYVLGGPGLISDQTAVNIFGTVPGTSEPEPTDPSHTHSYTGTVTAPTCTSEGYTTYICACGDSYISDYTAAYGHSYESYVTAPTCTENGYTLHICGICGYSYTAAVGHDYETTTVAPTTDSVGYDLHFCNNCGYNYADNYTDKLPAETEPEVTEPQEELTEELAYQRMIALKDEYPEGMRWTNDNFYAWKGGIYSGGYGCAGFAFLLSDAAFGDLPARMIRENISIDMIRVGDILRINNDSHSVIVLEVYDDYVVLAEGNYNSSIHWGRRFTAAQVAAADYVMTRYPQ